MSVWTPWASQPSPKIPSFHEGRIERGREKKKHLLAYLRDHREELRPFSRRISKKHAPAWSQINLPPVYQIYFKTSASYSAPGPHS